jgi:hypothetical protein
MPAPEARRRLLEHAATRLGGVEQLAAKLGISQRMIKIYLAGTRRLPDALFLRVVDLVSEEWRSAEGKAADPKDPNPKSRR